MKRDWLATARSLPLSMRFLLAGGFAAGVNWLVRFPLSMLMPFLPAVVAATGVGMAVGFVIYQAFVFPGSSRPLLLRIRDFIMVNIVASIGVAIVAMLGRSALLHFMDPGPAQAIGHALGIMAGALLNFIGHRSVTFRDRGGLAKLQHSSAPS
jgi:energy-coupling factor transport system substrate-specific component